MAHQEPKPATAEWVDHSGCGVVAMADRWLLDEFGQVWWADPNGWDPRPDDDIPVPVSEVKFWDNDALVTVSNELLYRTASGWRNLGPWPGGPSPAEKTTWSELKSEFK